MLPFALHDLLRVAGRKTTDHLQAVWCEAMNEMLRARYQAPAQMTVTAEDCGHLVHSCLLSLGLTPRTKNARSVGRGAEFTQMIMGGKSMVGRRWIRSKVIYTGSF